MQRRTLLSSLFSGFLFSLGSLGVFVLRQSAQAQVQNSESTSSDQALPTTRVPLGYKRGLEELRAVLEASEPTNAPPIRRVVIFVPPNYPESRRSQEAAMTAIREYFLIADSTSLASSESTTPVIPDLESEQGVGALLPNGGTIRLRIRRERQNGKERANGELRIRDHNIAGYEQVNQIEFIAQ